MDETLAPAAGRLSLDDVPRITRVEVTPFVYTVPNARRDRKTGKLQYAVHEAAKLSSFAVRISAEDGTEGAYVAHMGGRPPVLSQVLNVAPALVGERIGCGATFSDFSGKQLQTLGGLGTGALEICLWDLLGQYLSVPIGTLIGRFRPKLQAYASLVHGAQDGSMTTFDDLADAVKACRDGGFLGIKFRGWPGGGVDSYRQAIETVAETLSDRDDIRMFLDPGCDLQTFADALVVGRAADEFGLFWLEDMFRDTGQSLAAQRRLRERVATPLLSGEHVRGLEAKADWISSGATDFIRADPELDGGITGCLKIAALAEAFGMDVEIHGSGPAHRAVVAAIRNTNFYELGLMLPDGTNIHAPPVYACGYSDGFDCLDDGSVVKVPDGAGLGVIYDWDAIARGAGERHVFE